MKTKWLVLGLLGASVLFAQESPWTVKIVRVHGDPQTLAGLALTHSGVNYEFNEPLHAIVIRGKTQDVESAEKTIQELDSMSASAQTGSNVETTIYVVTGSGQALPGTSEVPTQLAPVVKQLRAIFPYSHYQLLSTMLIRSAGSGRAQTDGALNIVSNGEPLPSGVYQIQFNSASISPDAAHSIMLKNFKFGGRLPYRTNNSGGWQMANFGVETDVDVRPGQEVVIGKTNVPNSDASLFLVLSVRLAP